MKWSPFGRSVSHTGPPVGATTASSLCFSITASIPSARDIRTLFVILVPVNVMMSVSFANPFGYTSIGDREKVTSPEIATSLECTQ